MSLTLNRALKEGRLPEFVEQAEADGVGPGNKADFDRRLERVVKAPRLAGRTSRSRARGGSAEK